MSLNNDEFNKLMYGFAAELASEAKNWNTWDYFDWREFSYAGFHRAEFEAFLSLRKKHLRLLELPANADLTMIQKRFKQLAKEHHPDKGGNQELMCKLNIAYSYLKEHTRG